MQNIEKVNHVLTEAENRLLRLRVEQVAEPEESPASDEAEAGDLGAVNLSAAEESFDGYIWELIDALQAEFEVGEEEALDIIVEFAAELEAEGKMPPFPDDSATDESMTDWQGKAKSEGFADGLLKYADEMAEGEEE